jgi:hypothetical protein
LPRSARRVHPLRAPEAKEESAEAYAFLLGIDTTIQFVALAFAPECYGVDSKNAGGVFDSETLRKDPHDVLAFDLFEERRSPGCGGCLVRENRIGQMFYSDFIAL